MAGACRAGSPAYGQRAGAAVWRVNRGREVLVRGRPGGVDRALRVPGWEPGLRMAVRGCGTFWAGSPAYGLATRGVGIWERIVGTGGARP